MRQYIRLLFIVSGLLSANASQGATAERPPLMTERFYLSQADQNTGNDQGRRSWNKALLEMDIPGFQPKESGYSAECKYSNALVTLHSIKEDRLPSSYLALWAKNQIRVFAACDSTPSTDNPPVMPEGRALPKRAYSDFLYQLGSWHFYRGEFEKALKTYRQVEKIRSAPMRPKAAYMVIRSLAYLDEGEAAYDQIQKVLSDPRLQEVHAIAGNYRFVMMNNTKYTDVPHVTTELAKRHLKWLLSVVRIDPEKMTNPVQAKADYNDAMAQLNVYFPLYASGSKEIDWWLNAGEETPRMQAVKDLARTTEMVDWLQSKWAYNAFDDDWLWSLHAAQNPYWSQNLKVVEHELAEWKKSGNGAWLQLAISRVHPSDPQASILVSKASTYLNRPWKSETIEYKEWLLDLWAHSLRVSLGQGKIEQAVALIVNHQEISSLFDGMSYYSPYAYRNRHAYADVLEKALRWLVYNGQIESARTLLDAIQKITGPQSFTAWRTLLATTAEETMASGFTQRWFDYPATSKFLWQEMLNVVSRKFLDRLAADDRIPQTDRAFISRSLLTRAILLNAGPVDIDHAAAVAAKNNPAIREDILTAISGHQRIRYMELLLKHPRFRPVVFLEYVPTTEGKNGDENLDAIDINNHNDNNWWCRFDSKIFLNRVFKTMEILPRRSSVLSEPGIDKEFESYVQYQLALLEKHPYQSLIDDHEIEALESIPSGPEYLSMYVNQWEREAPTATTDDERSRRAANLHRAVRTTRHGCYRDGAHATYSRESFRLLHNRYDDTPWAKATPYWFNCPMGDC